MKASTIVKHIMEGDFARDDVQMIWDAVREKHLRVNQLEAAKLSSTLVPGKTKVGFGDKSAFGKRSWKEGVVTKVNRTTISVNVAGTEWTVPASMARVLETA